MKRTTVIISIILVMTILTVSITPAFAERVTALDDATNPLKVCARWIKHSLIW